MAITKEDRINRESTVSRFIQQKVPSVLLNNTFSTNTGLTQYDTIDKSIVDNLSKEDVVISRMTMEKDADLKYSMLIDSFGLTVEEPLPTSGLAEYNKVKVDIDREDHIFLFDWTEGNKRTFLHHPSGAYFLIGNDGNYVFKAKSDFIAFIEGDESHIIKGDRNKLIEGTKSENIKLDYNLTVNQNVDFSVGSNRTTFIRGSEYIQIGLDKISTIGSNEVINIGGFKEQNVSGPYIVNVTDTMLLNAPTIILQTNNLIYKGKASVLEEVGGKREMKASAIGITSLNNINISAGQNLSISATGTSEETILGASVPPPITAKTIDIKFGGFLLNCLAGGITLENLLASLDLGLDGSITLGGLMGSLNMPVTGITTLEGSTFINIGAGASEPAMLGQTHLDWELAHKHGSGTGPTTGPLNAVDLINSLSKKVFIE